MNLEESASGWWRRVDLKKRAGNSVVGDIHVVSLDSTASLMCKGKQMIWKQQENPYWHYCLSPVESGGMAEFSSFFFMAVKESPLSPSIWCI